MEKNREVLCGGVSLLISALFFAGCLKIPALSQWISSHGNINILVYGMTLVLFCLCFVLGMACTNKWKGPVGLQSVRTKRGIFWAALLVQLAFLAAVVYMETSQSSGVAYKYVWHTQPMIFIFVLFFLELTVLEWIYTRWTEKGKELDWFVWIVYIVLTVLLLYSMYTPNIFGRGEWSDYYHAHAYYNSIYNVHWGMPFTGDTTSIYGHYALLWKLPMKLIGGDFRGFVFLMACVGAITHFCAFLIIHQLVKSRLIRIVAAIAASCAILGMRGGYYWQLWPHRLVFPMIVLLYAVWVLKHKKQGWKTDVIAYLLCMISVIWNTETGIILAAAWAAMRISMFFSERNIKWKKALAGILLHGVGVVCSFAGAFGVVNLYNMAKGSPANTIQEFLMPLLSDSYMTDVLQMELPLFPCGYMVYIVLFFIGVASGIVKWRWFRKESSADMWKTNVVFFLSISALGRLVYYINRPAYHNLDCSYLSAIIIMAYLGEKALVFIKNRQWKNLQGYSVYQLVCRSISISCVIALFAISNGTVLLFSQNSYIKENLYNEEEMNQFAETFAAYVPENSFGFGINVAELYSWLHWNTQFFSIDFSDLAVAPQAAERLVRELQEKDVKQVVTTQMTMPIFQRQNPEGYEWFCENYVLDQSFQIHDEAYLFYVRKDTVSE